MTGEISSVKSAIKSCENELAKLGEITSTSIIASPHKSLLENSNVILLKKSDTI